jgi:hypothetical protein
MPDRNIKLIGVRGVTGSVLHCDFHACPIDLTVSNLVLFRMRADMLIAYAAMLPKFPVQMINATETSMRLLTQLGDLQGTLASRAQQSIDKAAELESFDSIT